MDNTHKESWGVEGRADDEERKSTQALRFLDHVLPEQSTRSETFPVEIIRCFTRLS